MSKMNMETYQQHQVIDFDIHGLVGIRLVNPAKSDVSAVKRRIGPLFDGSLNREPDIIIRFKKNLHLGRLTYLGLDEVGYNPDGFFVLKSKKASAKVRIPFESIGKHCEIECETGLRDIPHLITILNLTLCAKDCIPLHASAFVYKDKGILVTGWSKGGKTEALLGFLSHGARYVGDEWVILTKDGKIMYGIPEPITLWDWQIEQLPSIYPLLTFSDRLIFRVINFVGNMHLYFGNGKFNNTFPLRILSKAMPILRQQLHVNISPVKILENSCIQLDAEPKIIFFIMSHSEPSIFVEPWSPEDIARRMLHSVCYEQLRFFRHYQAFKFAFPDLQNHFLESLHDIQKTLLLHALNGKEAYRVLHPYPVSIDSLYRHMEPFCGRN